MTASAQCGPNWLAVWLSEGASLSAALEHFDRLPGADPAELAGLWRGQSLSTGHPFDGLLEALGWYGKAVLRDGRVHPLLFRLPSRRLIVLDPAWLPAGVALRWPAFAYSRCARVTFHALGPLLRTRGPAARIESRELRGQRGAAIVYDRQPIVDHLRRLDARRLVGLMERPGMTAPYFFLLQREAAPAHSEGPEHPASWGSWDSARPLAMVARTPQDGRNRRSSWSG